MELTFFDENFIPSYEYLETLLEELEYEDMITIQETSQAESDLMIDILQEDFLMEGIVGKVTGGAAKLAGKASLGVAKGTAVLAAAGTVALGTKIFNMFKKWFMKLRDFIIKMWHKMILFVEGVIKWAVQGFTSVAATFKGVNEINMREGSIQAIPIYAKYSQAIIQQIYKTYNLNYWYEKIFNFINEVLNGTKIPIDELERLRTTINKGKIVKVPIDTWKNLVNQTQTTLNNNKLAIHEINKRFRDAISKNDQRVAKLENAQSNEWLEQQKLQLTNYGKNLTEYRKACHGYISKLVNIGKELFRSLLYGSKVNKADMEKVGNNIVKQNMGENIPNQQAKQQQAQASLQQ